MKFKLEQEVSALIPQSIDFNYELLKADITAKLSNYNNLIVLEDGIKSAKLDRAALRDLSKTIEDKRKEVKRQWNKPCVEFEDKVKELVALIDKPINKIDEQIKAFEKRTKDEKEAAIHAFFDETIGDLKDLVSYQKLYDPKWMNVGQKVPEIKVIIELIIQAINADIKVIKDLKLECEQQMIDKYLVNFNMSEALAEKTRIEQQAQKLAEYNKQQEIKKQKEEALRLEEEAEKEAAEKLAAEEKEKAEKMTDAEQLSSLIGCDKPAWVSDLECGAITKKPEPIIEVISQGDYTGSSSGPVPEPKQIRAEEWKPDPQPVKQEYTQKITEVLSLRIYVTENQKNALRAFFIENKIKSTKINEQPESVN